MLLLGKSTDTCFCRTDVRRIGWAATEAAALAYGCCLSGDVGSMVLCSVRLSGGCCVDNADGLTIGSSSVGGRKRSRARIRSKRSNTDGLKSGANSRAVATATSLSTFAWSAMLSAISPLPRAVDVRETAMSAFCRAYLDARCDELTDASMRSRNFAERMRNRCFFFWLVISTLHLYLPSSFVPSRNVVTP